MVDFHRLKNLGIDLRGRAGEIAEQAKEKVVPLAGKAKDVAAKGVDKAAEGLDSATGHKFHDKLGDVTGNREKNPPVSPATTSSADAGPAEDDSAPGDDTAAADDSAASDDTAAAAAAGEAADTGAGAEASADDSGGTTDDAQPELLITSDDGSAHHPTPADMPQHRPSNDPS